MRTVVLGQRLVEGRRVDGIDPDGVRPHLGDLADPVRVRERIWKLARELPRQRSAEVHALDVEGTPPATVEYLEPVASCARRQHERIRCHQRRPLRWRSQAIELCARLGVIRHEGEHLGKPPLCLDAVAAPERDQPETLNRIGGLRRALERPLELAPGVDESVGAEIPVPGACRGRQMGGAALERRLESRSGVVDTVLPVELPAAFHRGVGHLRTRGIVGRAARGGDEEHGQHRAARGSHVEVPKDRSRPRGGQCAACPLWSLAVSVRLDGRRTSGRPPPSPARSIR